MQARHLFWVLLRDQVGPLLRAEGFRGSGQSWRLEHPSGNAALIRIQRSRWNTADSVLFTINLAVASKVVWDWQLTREPGRGPAHPRPSTRPVVTGRCRPSSHDPAGGGRHPHDVQRQVVVPIPCRDGSRRSDHQCKLRWTQRG